MSHLLYACVKERKQFQLVERPMTCRGEYLLRMFY